MKHFTLIALVLIVMLSSVIYADKPLERLGNEAAAAADELYQENKFVEAAKKYEEAYSLFVKAEEEDKIPLQDKITQMLTNMVTSYYQGKDFVNAVRIIEIRLSLDPKNDTFARQIAQIYERDLKDSKKAIARLEKFDEVETNFAVRRTLGRLYAADNDDANALKWYLKAFELRQDADVLQNIALLHHRTGNPVAAIKAYEDFIATNPRESVLINVYRNMGKFYDDTGDDLNSIKYYEMSNRLRFNRDITLLLLTKYYDRGDHLNARQKVDQLLADNSNNVDAIFFKALMLFEQERYSEAKREFEKISNDRRYGANARQYIESIESM